MGRDELNDLIDFAVAKKIHIISDEIYSGTVFDHPSFISIMEALMDRKLQDTDLWSRVHIVYSLSKDLGLPGFRVGMIYSNNETVVSAATKMSSFGLISSQTQYLLSKILSDKKFTRNYLKENRKRLKTRREMIVAALRNAGIGCLKSNAGLFCWVDMRHLLSSNTFDAEMELWKRILREAGLNISPGASCHCSEPGWFRMCFANMSEDTLNLSMQRIKALAERIQQCRRGRVTHQDSGCNSRRRSFSKWVLNLCSYDREPDRWRLRQHLINLLTSSHSHATQSTLVSQTNKQASALFSFFFFFFFLPLAIICIVHAIVRTMSGPSSMVAPSLY